MLVKASEAIILAFIRFPSMMGMSGSFRVLFNAINAAVEMVKTFVIKQLAAAVVKDVPPDAGRRCVRSSAGRNPPDVA